MKKISLMLTVMLFFSSFTVTAIAITGTFTPIVFRAMGPYSLPEGIEIQNTSTIKEKWPDSILFNLTLYSMYPIFSKDFQVGEYYVVGEEITAAGFYIDRLNEMTKVSSVTLTVINPNGEVACKKCLLENLTEPHQDITITMLDNQSFTFDMAGIWKIRVDFESDKEDNFIWKAIAESTEESTYQTFMPIGKQQDALDNLTFYNFYSEGIPVLTSAEILQLSSINYMAQQASYLNDTATSLKESSESTKQTVEFARKYVEDSGAYSLWMISATIALVLATLWLGIESWRLRKQRQNEEQAYGVKSGLQASKLDVFNAIVEIRNILKDRLLKEKSKRRKKNKPK